MVAEQDTPEGGSHETADTVSAGPLISVVTVTLNCAQTVGATIESVLAQSWQEFEFVIKDGGSTDGTLAVIGDYAVHRLVSRPDTGIYAAMNQAVALCRGDYLCFLNAGDTFADRETLAHVVRQITAHPEIAFFYGDFLSRQRHPIYGDPGSVGRPIFAPDRYGRLTAYLTSVCQQTWFVRRDLYVTYPLDTRLGIKADHDFFLHWVLERKIATFHIPEAVIVYAGGGVSQVNEIQLRQEHRLLLRRYFTPVERVVFAVIQKGRQVYRVARFKLTRVRPTT